LDEQAAERIHPQLTVALVDVRKDLRQHHPAFFDTEERLLLRINENGDYNFVKQFAATLDNVQMTVSYGIERTGVDGAAHLEGMLQDLREPE
jgi:hypothetical protein